VIDSSFITRKEIHFTALKFPRQRPLVLLIKVVWRFVTAVGSKTGQIMITGLL
jgi:hypothetical protein